jgi:stringent starvation protein B
MSPTKPYFVRALYDWIVDNGCTPYLLVDASAADCVVPVQFVRNGMIVLNLAPAAVKGLELGNAHVMFSARFGGVSHDITVPLAAIRAIYARENGQGLAFEEEAQPGSEDGERPVAPAVDDGDTPEDPGGKRRKPAAPRLTIVK